MRKANATSVEAKSFTGSPGGNSEREPPDPIPNSEVKTPCADGSVAASHARVGHCQAPMRRPRGSNELRGFLILDKACAAARPACRHEAPLGKSGGNSAAIEREGVELARASERSVCNSWRST